ncbi:MAG TPA: esterase-like activity of phytase family protein [Dongiaceae bacterium]
MLSPNVLHKVGHCVGLHLLAICIFAVGTLPAPAQSESIGTLRFIGSVVVPNDTMVDGTLVGGLSGIDYDPNADFWYLLSDDKSEKSAARFYVGKLAFKGSELASVDIQHAVTLLQANGKPYPDAKSGGEVPDPESIRRDPETGNLWWASEGDRKRGLSPFLRIAAPDGRFVATVPTPAMFHVNETQEIGPRSNNAFEGLSFAPDGNSVWLAMESALYQDGPVSTPSAGAMARLTRLGRDGKVLGQFAYPVDPIQAVPTGKHGDNGVSEFLAIDDRRALALERSGVEGADGVWTLYIRVYEIDTSGATDVAAIPSLVGASYRPVAKRLVINLNETLGLPHIDNIEGMSWGPVLANGKSSLVLVSDNNFNEAQVTEFLAFEVGR